MTDDAIEIPFSTDQYEKRLIVFIDLLGFSAYVRENTRGDGAGVVRSLTGYFQGQVSEGARYIHGKSFSFRPTFNFFSDTIIVTFPLNLFNAPSGFKMRGKIDMDKFSLLCSAVGQVCDIQLHALQSGLLTRGCITVGDVYHKKNTWFGPGLIDAYEHESKSAIYPRVMLSGTAFEYFESEVLHDGSHSWIQDSDGYYFVNYIAWIHTKLGKDYCEAHGRLREVIDSNLRLLRSQCKFYELQKWQWLAMYFNRYTNEQLSSAYGDELSSNLEIWPRPQPA